MDTNLREARVFETAKFNLQSNVIVAVVVGLFGLLTLKLGIRKFDSEKWWERRAEACTIGQLVPAALSMDPVLPKETPAERRRGFTVIEGGKE